METFLAVAEERSFSRAAARLHRTQPAVSQAIAKLEGELGEVLFEKLMLDPKAKKTKTGQYQTGEDVLLAKPQTYMNLSGISVRELLEKYELSPADLLVMWDEVQLPFGTIRIDRKGSGGSHNGANSVISAVGTQEFSRIRLGCGPDHPLNSRKEFVLRPMKKSELEEAAEMIGKAGDAVEMILAKGIEPAMNIFNRRKPAEAEEPENE